MEIWPIFNGSTITNVVIPNNFSDVREIIQCVKNRDTPSFIIQLIGNLKKKNFQSIVL